MSEQASLESQVAAGNRAEELRQNPLYQEAMRKLQERCFREWADSKDTDQAGREALFFTLRAARKFEEELTTIIGSGAMASNALKQKGKK
jgi:DNA-binding transcriptional regulator/RsmH inhibitor MraZ